MDIYIVDISYYDKSWAGDFIGNDDVINAVAGEISMDYDYNKKWDDGKYKNDINIVTLINNKLYAFIHDYGEEYEVINMDDDYRCELNIDFICALKDIIYLEG